MRTPMLIALPALLLPASLAAQQVPPVRPLGPVTKVSPPGVLGSVSIVRPLPGGGVIVSDIIRFQTVLLDADFNKVRAIADTTTELPTERFYPMGGIIPFKGDSTLYVDMRSLTMVVLDEKGAVARVTAVPSPRDVGLLRGGPYGSPGIDPRGRMVFLGMRTSLTRPLPTGQGAKPAMKYGPDSAPVYRMDLATRKRETVGNLQAQRTVGTVTRDKNDEIVGTVIEFDPLPQVDDWALMPDGRIAFVRGRDYHVDWLELDGSWTSTPKIPFGWVRMDDDVKMRVVDSVNMSIQRQRDSIRAVAEARAAKAAAASGRGDAMASANQGSASAKNPDVAAIRPPASGFGFRTASIPAKELADYRPAFVQGAARADADGNLWVRTTAPSDKGPIYDVINAKGELIDRVQLPFGRVISGFGKGLVYMGVLDDQGARLERARVK